MLGYLRFVSIENRLSFNLMLMSRWKSFGKCSLPSDIQVLSGSSWSMGGDLSSGGCDEFGTWLKCKVVSRRTREMAGKRSIKHTCKRVKEYEKLCPSKSDRNQGDLTGFNRHRRSGGMEAQAIKHVVLLQEWSTQIAGSRSRGMAGKGWIELSVGSRAETVTDLAKAVDRHA
jgi:hypothetical protein